MRNHKKPSDKTWTWPKGAAQDSELLWDDLPVLDDDEFSPGTSDPSLSEIGFLTDVPWGGIMRQEQPDEEEEEEELDPKVTRERGRVMRAGRCVIDAVFAFAIWRQRTNGQFEEIDLLRWQSLQPEVGVPWNARLGARIQVRDARPMPGTATVTINRDGPGPAIADPTRIAHANDVGELRAEFARQPEVRIDPPDIEPRGNPVAESFSATVTWLPDDGDPCPQEMIEPITVRWYRGRKFKIIRPSRTGKPRGTHARTGKGTVPRPSTGADRIFVVPTEIFWAVGDPQGCCGAGSGYTVIQFVRHMWRLNEDPPKEDRDSFDLDVEDSEIDRANANPPQPYDPTFTQNPRGTAPGAAPVVYPGPDGSGGTAIVQIDEPGLPEDLYNRFLEHGGTFAWQFVSLLVCELDNGVATDYLNDGLVEQELIWELHLIFGGGGAAPFVEARKRPGFPKKHLPCKSVRDVVGDHDLMQAYTQPEGHSIAVPTN